MKAKIALLILTLSSVAQAVNYMGPVGHREAFLANAGGAMTDSPGNVLLNPAGLGFRHNEQSSLSVSGNAIARQSFDVPQYAVDPEEMTVRPLLAAGIYPAQLGTLAVFFANPTAFNIYGGSETNESGVAVKSLLRVEYQELGAGLSYARQIHNDLAWGVSAGVSVETQKSFGYFRASQPGVTASTGFNLTEQKSTSLFITPGILYKATESWNVGFSMKATVDISSTANTTRFSTDSSSPTTVEESSTSFDPHGTNPYEFRLGQEFIFSPRSSLYFDVIYEGSGSSYNANNEKFLTDESWAGALGYRHGFFGNLDALGGYSYTETSSSYFNSFTAGIAMNQRSNELIVGGFYQVSISRESGNAGFNSYGIIFSSNVEY